MQELNNEFLREVGLLGRAITYLSDINFKKYNLQKNQFTYLTRICENRGITFSQLALILRVDKTTTTKVVKKLIENNYVYKVRDNDDLREYHIFATEMAYDVYDKIIEFENSNLEVCLAGFSEDEVNELVKSLKIINSKLLNSFMNRKGDGNAISK